MSDLDRIAAALGPAPRLSTHPTIPFSSFIPTDRDRAVSTRPSTFQADLDRAFLGRPSANVDRSSSFLPTDPDRPPPPAEPIRNEAGYFGYAHHARRIHELNRRDEYIDYLTGLAEESRAKILSLGREADLAFRAGLTLRGEDHRRRAAEFSAIVDEIETQIDQVRTGALAPNKVEVGPREWARINTDVGDLAPGGVHTDDRSALTGTNGRPSIDRTRHYNTVGGLRAPLAVHQTDLEEAVPRDADGRPQRLPDPRSGRWFRLANDGGPEADPTRGLNCVDGVLALFDTYIHGRPRVSAPRTFDTYAHGNPDRPLGGETNGVRRIQEATGATFQNLCPYVGRVAPAAAKPAIDLALRNLTNHLYNTGHGAYAFIITDMEAGGSHAWAATNHHGTILFLDPQIGRIAQNTPLYSHRGRAANTNITSMDALVVDANGVPAPLPHHGPGQRAAAPTGTPDESPTQRDERLALESLDPDDRVLLEASVVESERVALAASLDLHRIVATFADERSNDHAQIVDEDHRIKGLGSLARKVSGRVEIRGQSVATVLEDIKDRVRFSVQVPEAQYGQTVRGILEALQRIGYRDVVIENFWGGRGRHNGLNVNITNADGFVLEIQFPTPLSRTVGQKTHVAYEAVRFDRNSIGARVDAFLHIIQRNRDDGIYDHVPHGLDLLLGPPFDARSVDTSLVEWLQKDGRLQRYRRYLAHNGLTFEQVLRSHNLDVDDVPGMRELI